MDVILVIIIIITIIIIICSALGHAARLLVDVICQASHGIHRHKLRFYSHHHMFCSGTTLSGLFYIENHAGKSLKVVRNLQSLHI